MTREPVEPTADRFVAELTELRSDEELRKIGRYFKSGAGEYGEGDQFLGVRMADVFDLTKRFVDMSPAELEKPRDVLCELARSESVWERRTAIYATSYFLRKGELDDTFRIAEILLADSHDLIQKAVGGWLREAGKRDRSRLLTFLDEHAASMPRTTLRYAAEHLDQGLRAQYRSRTRTDTASPPP